ncbi:MAG TPA: aminotransferase class I/II-fold pyridoxal phosphate-dependent enzyme [Gemmatimonadaceae bacterium]|nr:aminotransferase class I/II-fold pyridoxal phosphate-dependent enzyme [Gemmatimonadaceae bacterium]
MTLAVSGAEMTERVCTMAGGLVGSEILKIAGDIRALREAGEQLCNLTVGDFDPTQFRIPRLLESGIEEALRRGETNYPPSDGVMALRESVAGFYRRWLDLDYPARAIVITGGSRPGIYATYRTLVDPGDRVVYPVPSWNNNHYCHLSGATGVPIVCGPETAFLPTRTLLEDAVRGARLLALNSPLNPTGTMFDAATLEGICDLVLEENARRGSGERPLYLMYDQVYWMLTFGDEPHVDPVRLRPEMAQFTVFVDGISKAFAATGVRVGWVAGPMDVIQPMASLLGHIGAWAPRAEQVATAAMLGDDAAIRDYRRELASGVRARLDALHAGLRAMRQAGLPVDAIEPMGAIYLSARFALNGMRSADGTLLRTNEDIRRHLLIAAGFAAVPFQAFGSCEETGWFRLSVGAASLAEIDAVLPRLERALRQLQPA